MGLRVGSRAELLLWGEGGDGEKSRVDVLMGNANALSTGQLLSTR